MLNFRNLIKRQRSELKSVVFHDADPLIAIRRHLGEFVLEIFPARFYFFDFFPKLVPPCLRFFHFGVELCLSGVKLLDLFEVRRGISFFLNRVIVLVLRFFQLALDEFDFLVPVLEHDRGFGFLLL